MKLVKNVIIRYISAFYTSVENWNKRIDVFLLHYLLIISTYHPIVTNRQLIRITKWYPIITTLMLTIGLVFLIYDITLYKFITPLFGCSFFMSMKEFCFSWKYKFCLWHQLLLLNLIIISLIAFIKAFDVFQDLISIRILLLINVISILLSYYIYLLISKIKCHAK